MNVELILFLLTVVVYVPLAGILLYVWWKHGKDSHAVHLARTIFLVGSGFVFLYLIFR